MIEFPDSEPFYDEDGNLEVKYPWNDHELQFVIFANLMGSSQLVEVEERSGVPLFLSPLYRVKIPVELGRAISSRINSIKFAGERIGVGYVEAYVLFEAIVVAAISVVLTKSNADNARNTLFELLEDCVNRRPELKPLLHLLAEWRRAY